MKKLQKLGVFLLLSANLFAQVLNFQIPPEQMYKIRALGLFGKSYLNISYGKMDYAKETRIGTLKSYDISKNENFEMNLKKDMEKRYKMNFVNNKDEAEVIYEMIISGRIESEMITTKNNDGTLSGTEFIREYLLVSYKMIDAKTAQVLEDTQPNRIRQKETKIVLGTQSGTELWIALDKDKGQTLWTIKSKDDENSEFGVNSAKIFSRIDKYLNSEFKGEVVSVDDPAKKILTVKYDGQFRSDEIITFYALELVKGDDEETTWIKEGFYYKPLAMLAKKNVTGDMYYVSAKKMAPGVNVEALIGKKVVFHIDAYHLIYNFAMRSKFK
ncbi:MAG: hypothetical protein A2096_17835 [Spirochaetes bacterium GWF1_41_5]|nr:MAG: hypothetical protein A2096_17835 [Spirochaetes bacterium GWF1_41_5]